MGCMESGDRLDFFNDFAKLAFFHGFAKIIVVALKIPRSSLHAGSIPAPGTNDFRHLQRILSFLPGRDFLKCARNMIEFGENGAI